MKEHIKKPFLEIFMALDLELNQNETGAKIIQIGAVVGNITTGEILETLSLYINPHEELKPFIINLTGITQEMVDSGLTLENAYSQLKEAHERHKCFINPVTWGQGDVEALHRQLRSENPTFQNFTFGRRIIDIKTLFVSWRIANREQIQGGLARSLTKLGLRFEGRKHSAESDALNTFILFKSMLGLLRSKNG